jgi:hypothetical protein
MSTLVIVNHTYSAELTEPRAPWRNHAACQGLDMEPEENSQAEVDALQRCRYRCPVFTQCSTWVLALTAGLDPGGVCGGTTERSRPNLRANASRANGRTLNTSQKIRAWCTAEGIDCPPRGPIHDAIRQQYFAHNKEDATR